MLRAVYRGGSSVILPNPHDEDLFYYYDTKEECEEALINNHDHDIDKHFKLYSKALNIFLGCYAYPFMEKVEGDDIDFKSFSIFDHEKEYKQLLKKYTKWLTRQDKWWYHIYIAVKMFDKGKMSLTKKEKETAQKIHDEGVNCEIYNYIIDYLNK